MKQSNSSSITNLKRNPLREIEISAIEIKPKMHFQSNNENDLPQIDNVNEFHLKYF